MRGHLVDVHGGCHDCGKTWHTRNAMALAARHAERYGHQTWVESQHSFGGTGTPKTTSEPRLL